jgi:hypothetical protein
MNTGTILFSWIGLTGNSMCAANLLELLHRVNERGIPHDDLPAVKAVWDDMKKQADDADIAPWIWKGGDR